VDGDLGNSRGRGGQFFYACGMAMHILGLTKDDFNPGVTDVLGVASFLGLSQGGQTLFI
jgi:peroxiredoxin family protein